MKKQLSTPLIKPVLSGLFLSLGLILPLFTAQIKEVGDSLLPMHIPVMLCGLICGAKYGGAVGFILPFFRSVIFGMPPIYPNGVYMALELATYGIILGIFRGGKSLLSLYISLISAQIGGRIVWGLSKAALLGVANKPFTFEAFFVGGFIDALPGIVLQLILIPIIIMIIKSNLRAKK